MKQPTPAVGIDLGTTFSAIAWLDDLGRPEILVNAEGDKLTPSAALFEGEGVVVGKEAIKALATEADDVALCAKRQLGARFFDRALAGRQYPPQAIEAWILHKLCRDARRQIGPFSKAVITVPAYFDDVRRKATQDAGYMAGLEVLDIINEPTAAAIAFGFKQSLRAAVAADEEPSKREPQNILVYDLGGGTFDVTVLEICGADFTALATDGDVALGGQDWDQRLMDHVVEQFEAQYGPGLRNDANAMGRLWRECEDAKRTLSARQKASIACDQGGHTLRVEVTRPALEAMTQDLLERTAFTTRETLAASGLTWERIDRVLLVGGSTRMPAVINMLTALSGKQPDTSISPDEAVAFGAALRAGFLLGESGESDTIATPFRIKNVNSHSLGVVGTDPESRRRRNAILIPRNSPLPATTQRVFKTQKPNQRSILVPIVEGESHDPEQCVEIGECVVPSLPPDLPPQAPIDVAFHYAENGRLTVKVTVDGGFSEPQFHLERPNSMTPEELDRWRRHISKVPPPK